MTEDHTFDSPSPLPDSSGDDDPVIDVRATSRRMAGDRELMKAMASFFVRDAPGLVRTARGALQNERANEAARAAHHLKGLASNFDAFRTQGLAARVECHARAGELEAALELIDELAIQVDRVLAALQASILDAS